MTEPTAEPASVTLLWSGDRSSARSAALASWRLCQLRQLMIWYPALATVGTVVNVLRHGDTGDASVWVGAAAFSVGVMIVCAVVYSAWVIVRMTYANRTRRVGPGTHIEAVWERDDVVFKLPTSELRMARTSLARARVAGDWVALHYVGERGFALWPRSLFPIEELARLSH